MGTDTRITRATFAVSCSRSFRARRLHGDDENASPMQGSPPRRSRRPQPEDAGSSFPLLPVLIGVVILGFVIGSGLSLVGKHSSSDSNVAVAPTIAATIPPATNVAANDTPSPLAEANSPQPIVLATPTPTSKPSPRPTVARTAAPVPSATPPSSTIVPSPPPTDSPAPVTSSITETSTAMPVMRASPSAVPATPSPVAPTVAPAPTEQPQPVYPIVRGAASPFARLAASVVRVYLGALGRGDRETAIAELATRPSGPLPEEGVVDGDTQIRTIDVHGAGDVVTVDVDLKTSSGSYAAQYTVDRSATGAALIGSHTIVKI
jgi:outer membrane biosynthesis protein TonB